MPQALQNADPANMAIFEPQALEMMAQSKIDASRPQTTAQKESAARSAEKEARLREKEDRLQGRSKGSGPPSAPAPAPPPPVPPPPPVDKSLLLDKLNAYRKRFPHLQKRNNVTVKSSQEEILDELHFCEMQLGSADTGGFAPMMFLTGVNAVETITREHWNPLNLRLEGLTNVCKDNMDQIVPILDELTIKYAQGMYMGPEMRLVLTIGAMAATVHSANSGNPAVANALNRASNVVAPPKGSEGL